MRDHPDLIPGATPHVDVMTNPTKISRGRIKQLIRFTPVITGRTTKHRAACRACTWIISGQTTLAEAQDQAIQHINLACQYERYSGRAWGAQDGNHA